MVNFTARKKVKQKKAKATFNKRQEGSALILTMVLLINAILIVSAIVAVSARQQQMSARTKNTAPALQLADSAMEYILQQYKSKGASVYISSICNGDDGDDCGFCAEYDCDGDASITIYFISTSDDGTDKQVIESDDYGTTPLSSVKYIRTVGTYGSGNETAVRALEASMQN
jgi:Tfp pilus assembly protein PilX